MSFINMPLGDAVAREAAPEGKYDLRVEAAEVVDSKDKPNQKNIRVRLSILGGDGNYKSIFHYIAGIQEGVDDAEKRNNKLLQCRAFMDAFGIDFTDDGFEIEDMLGAEASDVQLKQEDFEGTINNKLVIPW